MLHKWRLPCVKGAPAKRVRDCSKTMLHLWKTIPQSPTAPAPFTQGSLFNFVPLFTNLRELCYGSCLVESYVAEVEGNVYRDLDKVQNVEEKAEIEDKSGAAERGELHAFADDAESVADEQEDFKEKAFALCRARDQRFANGDRPGQTETKNRQRF